MRLRASISISTVLLASSCGSNAGRSLTIADDEHGERWTLDTATKPTSSDYLGTTCRGAETLDDPHALVLDACVRISPEPEEEPLEGPGDVDLPGHDTHTGSGDRCGFFNQIGAVDLKGPPDEPSILYCDDDEDGGLRHVEWSPANASLDNQVLFRGSCWPDVDSGAIFSSESGDEEIFWAALAGSDVDAYTTVLHDGPAPVSTTLPIPVHSRSILLVDTSSPLVASVDLQRQLWLTPLDADVPADEPVLDGVQSLAWTSWNDQAALIVCRDAAPLTLLVVDPDGEVSLERPLPETSCARSARPSIASDDTHLMIAWHDEEAGRIMLVDPEEAPVVSHELAPAATFPAVTWADDRYVVVDGSGQISTWTSSGTPLDSWLHPTIATRIGELAALRLVVDDDRVAFLVVGREILNTEGGHVYTYFSLEASVATLPSTNR